MKNDIQLEIEAFNLNELLPPTSFVIPCLNESLSIAGVLAQIDRLRPRFEELEVIVVDNGSCDDSVTQVRAFKATIVHCQRRGYGASLQAGISRSRHDLVVFADADGTYDWREALQLLKTLIESSSDLVVGNRLRGNIETTAMPFMHRWMGTPILSLFITILFGLRRGVRIGDCNGGLRAFRKSSYVNWGVRSTGMEFASEMIARAIRSGAKYREAPISYRRGPPGRRPHLRAWRDGLRHVRCMWSVFREGSR